MASVALPPCPPQLKTIQHYIKLANDYDVRNPPVAYWARLYALQSALKIDRKSDEAKKLLTALMDWLETFKKQNTQNESITNDVTGQAVLENEAHKLFTRADAEDRAANFDKNIVKMFYTCGIILDVCEIFGELTSEVAVQRKYAKWKATYIHNCLKNGDTPVSGMFVGQDEEEQTNDLETKPSYGEVDTTPRDSNADFSLPNNPVASSSHVVPTQEYGYVPQDTPTVESQVSQQKLAQAQKFCKYAMSAMDYEDVPTAVSNLEKALALLQ